LPSEPSKNLSASARTLADSSAQLEEREETLEMILDNLGEGVLVTDLEGMPIFANPKASVCAIHPSAGN
jgi:PAS domain-containing protein